MTAEQEWERENELICERLLGWRKLMPASPGASKGTYIPNGGGEYLVSDRLPQPAIWQGPMVNGLSHGGMLTPKFETWADAGLILDALANRWGTKLLTVERLSIGWIATVDSVRASYGADSAALAIRATALMWIKTACVDYGTRQGA